MKRNYRLCATTVALVWLVSSGLQAQGSVGAVVWKPWQFLIGEWMGKGEGTPGSGTGGFTFAPDLQNTILVRRNFARYPATGDKAAYAHDDLMVIYYEEGSAKAVYFDNERHIIHYTVTFAGDSSSVVFLGDSAPSDPRYRLTYSKHGEDEVGIVFEIARPGSPEAFTRYIEATAQRKK